MTGGEFAGRTMTTVAVRVVVAARTAVAPNNVIDATAASARRRTRVA
jgi:hypothetical protein